MTADPSLTSVGGSLSSTSTTYSCRYVRMLERNTRIAARIDLVSVVSAWAFLLASSTSSTPRLTINSYIALRSACSCSIYWSVTKQAPCLYLVGKLGSFLRGIAQLWSRKATSTKPYRQLHRYVPQQLSRIWLAMYFSRSLRSPCMPPKLWGIQLKAIFLLTYNLLRLRTPKKGCPWEVSRYVTSVAVVAHG